MAYEHEDKNPDDILFASDWNSMGKAIEQLQLDKANREGDIFSGDLTVESNLSLNGNLSVRGGASFGLAEGDKVGIGTTEPAEKLEVSGAVKAVSFLGDSLEASTVKAENLQGQTLSVSGEVSGGLKVMGPMVRQVYVATGLNDHDDANNGLVRNRVLTFTKRFPETAIKITYCDNFRVLNHSTTAMASWTILVNGADPPGGKLYFAQHYNTGQNIHTQATFVGHAIGVPRGTCTINVEVKDLHASTDAYTGHYGRWTIEAEEVLIL